MLTMKIRVRLHATLRPYLPPLTEGNLLEVELPAGATAGDVARALGIPEGFAGVAFSGGEKREMHDALQPGEELDLFPPLAGG